MSKYLMGQDIQLWVDGECVALATSMSVELSSDDIDISNKDCGSAGWSASKPGKKSWSISQDCDFTVTDYTKLMDTFIAGDNVQVVFSTVANASAQTTPDEDGLVVPTGGWQPKGDLYYGTASISSISLTANNGELSTYSISLNGVGALAKGKPNG